MVQTWLGYDHTNAMVSDILKRFVEITGSIQIYQGLETLKKLDMTALG
jgi:hypothetical protein